MIDGKEVNSTALEIVAYIVFGIASLIVLYVTVSAIKYFAFDKKRQKEKHIISWSDWYAIIGIVGTVAIWLFMFMVIFDPFKISSQASTHEENLLFGILIFLILILTFVLCLFGLNWHIELKEDSFEYTNLIGLKHIFKYDEIEIKTLRAVYRCYKGGKYKFTISFLQKNSDALCLFKSKHKSSN